MKKVKCSICKEEVDLEQRRAHLINHDPDFEDIDADEVMSKFSSAKEQPLIAFDLELSALAHVSGTLVVFARNPEEAKQQAIAHGGDVIWKYNWLVDNTLEMDHYETKPQLSRDI